MRADACTLAAVLACAAGCAPTHAPMLDASPALDARSARDAIATGPPCDAGTTRHGDGGACVPADPCFPLDPCAAQHRVCGDDLGTARCGRCLDLHEDRGGACEPAPITTYRGPAIAGRDQILVWDGAEYRRLFVRGMNLGATPPGTGPRDFGATAEQYVRWLDLMRESGVNAVRLYTLHPPRFYDALAAHNAAHPDAPIYLLQGVWLEDPSPGASLDLLPAAAQLDGDVERTIDCLHGAATIDPPAHPSGAYTSDVSDWTIGLVLGREVGHDEVLATDAAHPGLRAYEGETLRLAEGTASEAWVVERLDRAAAYGLRAHGEAHPVAFSNWMELDPLHHPTEGSASGKDVTQIDLARVEAIGASAGHFVSFHVYPYYPDYVSEDPRYLAYADEHGVDAYRGVLRALRAHFRDQALLVAEYGVPSSWGRAHTSASGMHHGGLSEDDVGLAGTRMLRDIAITGLAGGVWFQWEDGWWKRIWITNRRTIAERLPLWHDLMNAQQGYGVLAFDPPAPSFRAIGEGVEAAATAEALELRLTLARPLADGETITIGLDTYADDRGELVLPDGTRATRRSELALAITAPARAELAVATDYDLHGLGLSPRPDLPFRSTASDGRGWAPMRWQINAEHGSDDGVFRFAAEDFAIGSLRARRAGDAASSLDAVVIDGATIAIRLPWVLLQFADPSSLQVIDGLDAHATSEGVALSIARDGALWVETERLTWERWDVAPATTERVERGAEPFFEAMRAMPRWVD